MKCNLTGDGRIRGGAMRSKLKTEGYESIISSSSNRINHGEIISLSLEAGVA